MEETIQKGNIKNVKQQNMFVLYFIIIIKLYTSLIRLVWVNIKIDSFKTILLRKTTLNLSIKQV